jgi:hypothetical protein
MDSERFGELIGEMAYALVKAASPEEADEMQRRWTEAGELFPLAVMMTSNVVQAVTPLQVRLAEIIDEAASRRPS